MDRWFKYGIGIAFPLLWVPLVIDPVHWPRFVFLALIGIALVLIDWKKEWKLGPVSMSFGVFVLWQIISSSWALSPLEGLTKGSKLVILWVLCLVVESALIRKRLSTSVLTKTSTYLVWTLMILGLVFLIPQYLFTGELKYLYFTSSMANKNLFASALFLLMLFQFHPSVSRSYTWYIIISGIWMWIFFIASRGVMLTSGVFLLYLFAKESLELGNLSLKPIAFALAGSLLLVSSVSQISPDFSSKEEQMGTYYNSMIRGMEGQSLAPKEAYKGYVPYVSDPSSSQVRLIMSKASIILWLEQPLTGYGLGSWRHVYPSSGLSDQKYEVQNGWMIFQRPHNEFAGILVESGVIGLILFLAFWLLPVALTLKYHNLRTAARNPLLVGLVLFGGIMALDFPLERATHFLLLILLVVICVQDLGQKSAMIQFPNRAKPLSLLLLSASLLLTSIQCYGENRILNALMPKAKNDWGSYSLNSLKIPFNLYPYDPFAFPSIWYRGLALFQNGQYHEAVVAYKKASRLAPNNINVLNDLASSYYLSGNLDSALHYYDRAVSISPRFEESLINKAAVLFNAGRTEGAYESISSVYLYSMNVHYRENLQQISCAVLTEQGYDSLANQLKGLSAAEFHTMYRYSQKDLRRLISQKK